MSIQFVLNVLLAFIWMFLNDSWTMPHFIAGFLIGIIFIGIFSRFWSHDFYLKRFLLVLKLLGIFIRELFQSSFAVLIQILRPNLQMKPGIFELETELRTGWEITILSCLICLTPGTLTLEVSKGDKMLYIHAMDIADAKKLSDQIKGTFEKAIMEVTRS